MPNPENNWVHISIKAPNGALFDARAEDGDTLQALVDGTLGQGVWSTAASGFDPETVGVEAVKSTFGKTTEVKSENKPGGFGAKPSGFGGTSSQQSLPDKIELGTHEGYLITLQNGKFGWYANAYNRDTKQRLDNKNLPKGADPGKFGLAEAVALWSE